MIFFGEAIMGLLIVNSAETKYYHIPLALGVLSVMVRLVYRALCVTVTPCFCTYIVHETRCVQLLT